MNFKHLKHTTCRFLCLLFIFTFTMVQIMVSQEDETKFDEYINEGNFEKAVELGNQLLVKQSGNPELNFKVGYCYLNLSLKKGRAILYLEKADSLYKAENIKSTESFEALFYLGKAYHKNYQFDKALKVFEQMKTQIKNNELSASIDEEIDQCNVGALLIQQPVKMQVTNIGDTINSQFADHSPVLTADESVLIFTSRRKRFENELINTDGQFNEDIYISSFNGTSWSEPQGISSTINSEEHEASIGISADGQQLLIYSEAEGGTISISTLMGDVWSAPINAGVNINSRSRETHASMSADGQLIYFTSDRPGGYGGLDIYVSEKQADGTWGKAVNLGKAINTEKDEEGPFIHYDGKTLYFSSKGHETMGGYDIFAAKKNEFGTWALPENLGYPINTTEDDVFFTMTADGKRAYFSSYREGGNGGIDIFMMGLPEAEEKPLTVISGVVAACKSDIAQVEIKVYEMGKNKIIGIYKPNSKTGKYLYILDKNKKYESVFEISGKEVYRDVFQISGDSDFQILYKHIELKSKSPCDEYVGRPFSDESIVSETSEFINTLDEASIVENIMFKVNTADLDFFKENLQKLANILIAQPDLIIEIVGYSDTQGPEAYNINLSNKRAKGVYDYLIKLGVNKNQLNHRGDGVKNQITINNYKDGTYVWQSLPYNRRVEFNIISGKSDKLKIKQFKIPKVYSLNKETINENDFIEYEKIYTIQIGAYSKPISLNNFPKLMNIQMYYNGKLYHYTVGEFESEEKANEQLVYVNQTGYKDAFIRKLGYYFPKKITDDITKN